MVDIDELCKELSADDMFAGSALREAIEKVRTLDRPDVETELVLMFLARTIGNANRSIIGMVASIEGGQALRNTKQRQCSGGCGERLPDGNNGGPQLACNILLSDFGGRRVVRIKAKSVMGWPTWVVEVGEPIDADGSMERPVRFINAEHRGAVFSQDEAESLLPFVLKVRPDAEIVPVG